MTGIEIKKGICRFLDLHVPALPFLAHSFWKHNIKSVNISHIYIICITVLPMLLVGDAGCSFDFCTNFVATSNFLRLCNMLARLNDDWDME